ncbi:hypothetical protein B0J11DRAFT_503936 [Dendryphion nanum]|uniref:Uncharacterized protein n=1 Tax=Dendryphion nanum TaxID=256645 RepID=A0A9P9E0U0_9PLEO|nr:hypothetical protein B0J11DRAFT_503936 [Dendryphion nanum]
MDSTNEDSNYICHWGITSVATGSHDGTLFQGKAFLTFDSSEPDNAMLLTGSLESPVPGWTASVSTATAFQAYSGMCQSRGLPCNDSKGLLTPFQISSFPTEQSLATKVSVGLGDYKKPNIVPVLVGLLACFLFGSARLLCRLKTRRVTGRPNNIQAENSGPVVTRCRYVDDVFANLAYDRETDPDYNGIYIDSEDDHAFDNIHSEDNLDSEDDIDSGDYIDSDGINWDTGGSPPRINNDCEDDGSVGGKSGEPFDGENLEQPPGQPTQEQQQPLGSQDGQPHRDRDRQLDEETHGLPHESSSKQPHEQTHGIHLGKKHEQFNGQPGGPPDNTEISSNLASSASENPNDEPTESESWENEDVSTTAVLAQNHEVDDELNETIHRVADWDLEAQREQQRLDFLAMFNFMFNFMFLLDMLSYLIGQLRQLTGQLPTVVTGWRTVRGWIHMRIRYVRRFVVRLLLLVAITIVDIVGTVVVYGRRWTR